MTRVTDREIERRKAAIRAHETSQEERFIWLSFADPTIPKGLLGVTVVKARGPLLAMERAWDLGINPGGSCQPADLGPDEAAIRAEYGSDFDRLFEKLMPPDEVRAMMARQR